MAAKPKTSLEDSTLNRALAVMRHLWSVDHAVRHLSHAMEIHLGVTSPQRLVVRVVGRRPGVSAGELAQLLKLDASTLTGHLRSLEDLGLLTRKPSPIDGRRVDVFLTARGKKLDVSTRGTVEAAVAGAVSRISARELAVVSRFLDDLVDELEGQVSGYTRRTAKKSPRKKKMR